jgi:hypothetical protein
LWVFFLLFQIDLSPYSVATSISIKLTPNSLHCGFFFVVQFLYRPHGLIETSLANG